QRLLVQEERDVQGDEPDRDDRRRTSRDDVPEGNHGGYTDYTLLSGRAARSGHPRWSVRTAEPKSPTRPSSVSGAARRPPPRYAGRPRRRRARVDSSRWSR